MSIQPKWWSESNFKLRKPTFLRLPANQKHVNNDLLKMPWARDCVFFGHPQFVSAGQRLFLDLQEAFMKLPYCSRSESDQIVIVHLLSQFRVIFSCLA